MTWFKGDDGFYDHPRVVATSMAARGLWFTAATYCARHETDGHIDEDQVRRLGGTGPQIRVLLSNSLWIRCELHANCIAFRNWLKYQPSRDQLRIKRATEAERKQKAREAKAARQGKRDSVPADVREESRDHRTPDGRRESALPDPTRPDPTRLIGVEREGADPARTPAKPSDRCPIHAGVENPPACGGCAQARRDSESWQQAKARADADAAREWRAEKSEIARAEIEACDMCGDDGYRIDRAEVCNHRDIDTTTARRHIAEMRANLNRKETA